MLNLLCWTCCSELLKMQVLCYVVISWFIWYRRFIYTLAHIVQDVCCQIKTRAYGGLSFMFRFPTNSTCSNWEKKIGSCQILLILVVQLRCHPYFSTFLLQCIQRFQYLMFTRLKSHAFILSVWMIRIPDKRPPLIVYCIQCQLVGLVVLVVL